MEFSKDKKASLEIHVPVHVLDILNIASSLVGNEKSEYSNLIIQYFINTMVNEDIQSNEAHKHLNNGLLKGKLQRKIQLHTHEDLNHQITTLKARTKLQATADIVSLAILRIYEEMLRFPNPFIIQDLRRLLSLSDYYR